MPVASGNRVAHWLALLILPISKEAKGRRRPETDGIWKRVVTDGDLKGEREQPNYKHKSTVVHEYLNF